MAADPRPVPTGSVKLYEWEAKGADYALIQTGTYVKLKKWDEKGQAWYGETEEGVAYLELLKLAGIEFSYHPKAEEGSGAQVSA